MPEKIDPFHRTFEMPEFRGLFWTDTPNGSMSGNYYINGAVNKNGLILTVAFAEWASQLNADPDTTFLCLVGKSQKLHWKRKGHDISKVRRSKSDVVQHPLAWNSRVLEGQWRGKPEGSGRYAPTSCH